MNKLRPYRAIVTNHIIDDIANGKLVHTQTDLYQSILYVTPLRAASDHTSHLVRSWGGAEFSLHHLDGSSSPL